MINKKFNSGFTLIETVMVIVIVGILAGGSSMYIKQVIDTWNFQNFLEEAVSQGRIALIRMTREIRQAIDLDVYSASQTNFSFKDANDNIINYTISADNLYRGPDLLLSGVGNFTFSYYNKTNQLITSPELYPSKTDIKRIDIDFQVQSGSQTKRLRSQVWPRNFRR